MGFRINTNIAALNSHTAATMNNRSLDNSLSKLSSGLRINKAADDASGLSIANSLRAQASSLAQAVSNGNDAIGLIQTADGALNEYSSILDTIKTKAVQAASDGQNSTSRLAIQKDIDRLLENLNNIAKTTSFNGQKLLSGTFTNKEFQMGSSANETVKASISSAETSQIGQTTQARLDIAGEGENQLTLVSGRTGESITLEPFELLSNNKAANGMGAVADQINKYSADTGITAKAVVGVTSGVIAAGTTGIDFRINGILIGAVNVSATDKDGTLLNAINKKTSETGVIATKNQDGTLALSSKDGRAIETTGDIAVMGASTTEMSTLGYLEVSQAGSSTFQIKGANTAAAVGEDITTSGNTVTVEDSLLTAKSVIKSGSTIAAGSALGGSASFTLKSFASVSASQDGLLTAGSILKSGTKLENKTELTTTTKIGTSTLLTADMFIKAGSILKSSTNFDAGTVLQQDITVGTTLYKAGTTLTVDLKLDKDTTLIKDMVMKIDTQNQGARIISGSTFAAGTIVGAKITTSGNVTLAGDMKLLAGSLLKSGSTMKAGSILGDKFVVSSGMTTIQDMDLKLGSTLISGSKLVEGSTIGGTIKVGNANVVLSQDMLIKEGSILKKDSILKAGTILNQDLTDAEVGGGTGSGLSAGTVLGTDVKLTADVNIKADFTMLKGATEGAGYGTIAKASTIATNTQGQNSVNLGDEDFTNLSDINVTTLKGAMRAISTLESAITDLDTIRSDLGSVQNQLVSTINNISVTQVNVKSAESNIRDVDFAAESANFSKFNILAQSGSYAMSQANAVQQNVLRLLQ
ncbi:MAG: flagellin [Campylobacteraceae bacterium]|nr:flagellin [Campylobacteraceae bacterium]